MDRLIKFKLNEANGRWEFTSGHSYMTDSHNPACMKEVLGIYTQFEATVKIPVDGSKTEEFWVTCKNYCIQYVHKVLIDLDLDIWVEQTPVNEFHFVVASL